MSGLECWPIRPVVLCSSKGVVISYDLYCTLLQVGDTSVQISENIELNVPDNTSSIYLYVQVSNLTKIEEPLIEDTLNTGHNRNKVLKYQMETSL